MEEKVCSPTDVEVVLSVSWLWMLLTLIGGDRVVPPIVVDSPDLRVDWVLTVVDVDTVDSVAGDVEVDNLAVVVSAPWKIYMIILSDFALLL